MEDLELEYDVQDMVDDEQIPFIHALTENLKLQQTRHFFEMLLFFILFFDFRCQKLRKLYVHMLKHTLRRREQADMLSRAHARAHAQRRLAQPMAQPQYDEAEAEEVAGRSAFPHGKKHY